MSITTHGYLPAEAEPTPDGRQRVSFTRVALADMTTAELAYIAETRGLNTLVNPAIEKNSYWMAAYNKLKAAREKA